MAFKSNIDQIKALGFNEGQTTVKQTPNAQVIAISLINEEAYKHLRNFGKVSSFKANEVGNLFQHDDRVLKKIAPNSDYMPAREVDPMENSPLWLQFIHRFLMWILMLIIKD